MKILRKILNLLTNQERKAIYRITALSIIGAILETFSLVMIFPLLDSILNNNYQLPIINDLFQSHSQSHQIYIVLTIFINVALFKAIFLIFLTWKKADTSIRIHNNLIKRIYQSYLTKNFKEYSSINTATILHKVTTETNIIMQNSIGGLLNMLKDIFLICFTSIILVYTNYQITILLFGLVICLGFLINMLSKNLSTKWGEVRKNSEESRLRTIKQSVENIIEIILLNKSSYFIQELDDQNSKLLEVAKKQATLRNLPRPTLELIATFGIVSCVIFLTYNNNNISQIIPTLGLFGVIALRIIPSFSHVLRSLYNIRYSLPSLEPIVLDLVNLNSKNNNVLKSEEIHKFASLSLKNVSFMYDHSEQKILKDINLTFSSGEMIGIIGKSGSGKSTIASIILGLLQPSNGEVIVNSKKLKEEDIPNWHKIIGYVSQKPVLLDKSIYENISFGGKVEDHYKMDKSLKLAQLKSILNDDKLNNNTIGEFGNKLSGGEKQRLTLARALYHDRDILILDEPTSSLDPVTKEKFLETLKGLKGKKTIILISHQYDTMRFCDRYYEVKNKKLNEIKSINEN